MGTESRWRLSCFFVIICIVCNPLRLVAVALLYLDQEDAFWSLVAIVEVFMPRDYYTKTLLGSQVNTQSQIFSSYTSNVSSSSLLTTNGSF